MKLAEEYRELAYANLRAGNTEAGLRLLRHVHAIEQGNAALAEERKDATEKEGREHDAPQ